LNKIYKMDHEERYFSLSSKNELSSKNIQNHNFQLRFFHRPVLCFFCKDYIYGEGYVGYGCNECSKYIHATCGVFRKLFEPCSLTRQNSSSLDTLTYPNYYPVDNWTEDTIKEWLAVVNLHRYAEIFHTYNINGAKLFALDLNKLNALRIRDEYHQQAILQARNELLYISNKYSTYDKMLDEEENSTQLLRKLNFKASSHHFLVHTVSKLTDCDVCSRPMLGIVSQGLQCQICGLLVHRKCSITGLPECQHNQNSKILEHKVFGSNLIDSAQSNLLENIFHIIETNTHNEDLYDAYRLSAESNKVHQIKKQINETGVDLIALESYDLITLASLAKAYLRDLQNSVIPEQFYEKLCTQISEINIEKLKSFIDSNLDPVHLNCLKLIMKHLIKVWSYQHRVKGCNYLPDKLFHIFRRLILR
jgi:hypothetical protein